MKPVKRALLPLVLAFGLFTATAATAATFYVATNGSDSHTCSQAQSQSTPKRTLNAGILCLSSGDTLEVKAGTYAAPLAEVEPPSGSSWSNPTTIKRFGSDTVTIKGVLRFGNWGAGGPKSYIVIDGFIIDGQFSNPPDSPLIWAGNGSHHIKIANNEIKNSVNNGIQTSTCEGCWIIGNKIHTIGTDCSGITARPCPSREFNVGYSAGIYMGDRDVVIELNEFYDFAGSAIQMFNSGARPTDNTIVRYNRIRDGSGSWARRGDGLNGAWGIILANGRNLQAYGNIISNLRGLVGGSTVSNSPYGILVMSSCFDCKVYNNTIYNNPAPAVVVHASGTIIKNNIFWNNAGIIDDHSTRVSYFASNNLCSSAATGCAVTSDPLFVNPASGNFQLQGASPAINAGTTSIASGVSWAYSGAAPDIGAYEFGSSPDAALLPVSTIIPSAPTNLMLLR